MIKWQLDRKFIKYICLCTIMVKLRKNLLESRKSYVTCKGSLKKKDLLQSPSQTAPTKSIVFVVAKIGPAEFQACVFEGKQFIMKGVKGKRRGKKKG